MMSANPTPSILFNSGKILISAKLYKNFSSMLVSLLNKLIYNNMLFWTFSTITPAFTASCGSSSSADETLF